MVLRLDGCQHITTSTGQSIHGFGVMPCLIGVRPFTPYVGVAPPRPPIAGVLPPGVRPPRGVLPARMPGVLPPLPCSAKRDEYCALNALQSSMTPGTSALFSWYAPGSTLTGYEERSVANQQ